MFWTRIRTFAELVVGLRKHDFRAALTWMNTFYADRALPVRVVLLLKWSLTLMWRKIPETAGWAFFSKRVSRTPIWLAEVNPFENYPYAHDPDAELPEKVEVVVIGAGMVGAAAAYHWSKLGNGALVVLEKDSVASGSAGRNEGLLVMGRYYFYVHQTVRDYLARAHPEVDEKERDCRAHGFAAAYVRAAYANAEMIAETIRTEGIDCDYQRKGWVQVPGAHGVSRLEESSRMAQETNFADWIKICPQEAFDRGGIITSLHAGFSIGAATWNPAKWVWGIMRLAVASPQVSLYTRTPVLRVIDEGEAYVIHSARGKIKARYVINATESHTPCLFPDFHNIVIPMQTQAAWGKSDGGSMKPGVGISSDRAFYGRHGDGVLFGSDATRVRDQEAGRNQPSRFITRFVLTEMKPQFGVKKVEVSHEWSGTVSYTPDEFPLVGLMDGKRLYIVGGMAGSGSGIAFNAARHVVSEILRIDCPNYYPAEYFSPQRFTRQKGL